MCIYGFLVLLKNIHMHTSTDTDINTYIYIYIYIYIQKIPIYIYVYIIKIKSATVVESDLKAPFSIATTSRCRGGCYSIPWIAPLNP